MPESKSRHPHKHPHQQEKQVDIQPKTGNNNSIVTIAIIFFAVTGIAIGCFIDYTNILLLAGCAAAGGVAGYFAGLRLKKSLSGK